MAVVYKTYRPGLVRAYSDKGLYIKNPDGEVYYEAIDPDWTHRTYEETEEEIEIAPDEALSIISGEDTYQNYEESDGDLLQSSEEALNVILGGETE